MVQDEVFPVVEVLALGIVRIEGLPENERAFPVPKAVVDGHLFHVGGSHHVLVLAVDFPDAGDVGRNGYVVVRNPLGHPCGADFVLADAHNLELPDLVFVGHREAFTAVSVAILLCQGAHEADGVAGVVAALKGHALQFLDGEPAGGVHEGVGATESGLSHGQLLLVEAGVGRVQIGICMRHLRNLTHELDAGGIAPEPGLHGASEHGMHRPGLMVCGGFHLHPGTIPAVAGVGSDDGTVGGGFLAHHQGGAALAVKLLRIKRQDKDYSKQQGE